MMDHNFNTHYSHLFWSCDKCGCLKIKDRYKGLYEDRYHYYIKGAEGSSRRTASETIPSCHEILFQQLLK